MKIERLMGIIMQLLYKEKVTAKELASRFAVSTRTILRDMDTLTLAGIPIYSDVGSGGGYQLLETFTLDKSVLNQEEGALLLTLLEALSGSLPYPELRNLYDKFSAALPDEARTGKTFMMELSPWHREGGFKEHLQVISKGIEEELCIHIAYIDQELKRSQRMIEPHTLIMMAGQYYLYGFCQLRKDFRLFKLARLVEVALSNESFDRKPLPVEDPYSLVYGQKRPSEEILLRFDKVMRGRLPDYFSLSMIREETDGLWIKLDYPIDEWLLSFLASFMPYVEVMSPESLRKAFHERLLKALEKNK